MNVKRMAVLVVVLAVGVALGALFFAPADVAQGQEGIVGRIAFEFPPSPCEVEVQSRILTAVDGTATARMVAFPPSPCGESYFVGVIFQAVHEPADTASCQEFGALEGASLMTCAFSAEHQTSTFSVLPIGRRGMVE